MAAQTPLVKVDGKYIELPDGDTLDDIGNSVFDSDYPADSGRSLVASPSSVGSRWTAFTSPSEYRVFLCIAESDWMVERVVSMSDPTTADDVTEGFYNSCTWSSCASNQVFQLVDEDNGIWIAPHRGNW